MYHYFGNTISQVWNFIIPNWEKLHYDKISNPRVEEEVFLARPPVVLVAVVVIYFVLWISTLYFTIVQNYGDHSWIVLTNSMKERAAAVVVGVSQKYDPTVLGVKKENG